MANFHIYNPTQSLQTPTMGGVTPVSVYVDSEKGVLPWVYETPGGVVSQPNPVASVQATVPDAPILVSAIGANVSIILFWIAPPDSGSAITDYRYTTDTGATKTYKTLGTTDTTATITTLSSSSATLVNGTSYTVSIIAINSIGTSIASESRTASPAITAPTPPTLVSATAGNQSITLTWTAPTSDGGSAIVSYRYTTDGGTTYAVLKTGAPAATTITTNSAGANLINGTAYTIAIVAVNGVPLTSGASNTRTATPVAGPGAPTLDSATGGNQSITLVWTAPGSTGGSPIADYKYSSDGGTSYKSLGTTGTTATITTLSGSSAPLVNGTTYPITIVAVNGFQITGPPSLSRTATPVGAPGAPTFDSATGGNGSITLAWTAPTSDGGSAIVSYRYTTDGGTTYAVLKTGAPAPTAITTNSAGAALVNGTAYTIAIVAVNGVPLTSGASNTRTATPTGSITAPGAPFLYSARGGDQSITLEWTPPSDGGSPITGYLYTTDTGATKTYRQLATGPATTATITLDSGGTALVNGTSYTISIVAVNIAGPGTASNTQIVSPVPISTMVLKISVSAGDLSAMPIRLSLDFNPGQSVTVDWGDSTPIVSWTTAPTHTYGGSASDYTLTITGTAGSFFGLQNQSNDTVQLVSLTSWLLSLESLNSVFRNQLGNFTVPAVLPPNVFNLGNMFQGATAFNQYIGSWNTTGVISMVYMFEGATSFNQDISSWDTAAVDSMSFMFSGATAFNNGAVTLSESKPLNSWNTAAVTNMNAMFDGATSFNQDISSWDTAAVTTMAAMFKGATAFNNFNQPLAKDGNKWNTAAVTDMAAMFEGAASFNQDISSWNTAAVTTMISMFTNATVFNNFNQPLTRDGNKWNTAAVIQMSSMFQGATAFNQPLNSWSTAAVVNMSSMFQGATAFNQPLNSWSTAAVVNMISMFQGATAFNSPPPSPSTATRNLSAMFNGATNFDQDISSWNTAAVTNMSIMFQSATKFNQPLIRSGTSWNTAAVTTMVSMFRGATTFNQNLSSWSLRNPLAARSIFASGAPIGLAANYGNWPAFTATQGGAAITNRNYYTT